MGGHWSSHERQVSPKIDADARWTQVLAAIVAEGRPVDEGNDVEELIINAKRNGKSPLHLVCSAPLSDSSVGAIEQLLSRMNSKEVGYVDKVGMTAFGYAIQRGNKKVLEKFVENKAVDVPSLLRYTRPFHLGSTLTPMHHILTHGSSFAVTLLASLQLVDLVATTSAGLNLVHILCTPDANHITEESIERVQVAEYLFHRLPLPMLTALDDRKRTPLQIAIGFSQPKITKLLLDILGDHHLGMRSSGGCTPIHYIGAYDCSEGNLTATAELVISRASTPALLQLDSDNCSFLHRICSRPLNHRRQFCHTVALQTIVRVVPDVVRELLFIGPRNPLHRLSQMESRPVLGCFEALFEILDDMKEEEVIELFCSKGNDGQSAAVVLFTKGIMTPELVMFAISRLPAQVIQRPQFDSSLSGLHCLLTNSAEWKKKAKSLDVFTRMLDAFPPSALEECPGGRDPYLFMAVKRGLFAWAMEIMKRLPNGPFFLKDKRGCSILQETPLRGGQPLLLDFFVALLEEATPEELRHSGNRTPWLQLALKNSLLHRNLRRWIGFVPDFVFAHLETEFDIVMCLIQNYRRDNSAAFLLLGRLSERAFLVPRTSAHFWTALASKVASAQSYGVDLPSEELIAAILERSPAGAFYMKNQNGDNFLHSAVTAPRLCTDRLQQLLAGAPPGLLLEENSQGCTALEIAKRHPRFPKNSLWLLQTFVKGAQC